MFDFGQRSKERLGLCHPDLMVIHYQAIQVSPIDYGIAETRRTQDRARMLFEEGRSQLDPSKGQFSKHLGRTLDYEIDPDGVAFASDIYIWHKDATIRRQLNNHMPTFAMVAGVILSVANRLYEDGSIQHRVRWGGNWDGDQQILIDQGFDDGPHFELVF